MTEKPEDRLSKEAVERARQKAKVFFQTLLDCMEKEQMNPREVLTALAIAESALIEGFWPTEIIEEVINSHAENMRVMIKEFTAKKTGVH